MKLRTGFVSNSSSSSFAIIGITDERLIKKLMDADGIKTDKMREEEEQKITKKLESFKCPKCKRGISVEMLNTEDHFCSRCKHDLSEILEEMAELDDEKANCWTSNEDNEDGVLSGKLINFYSTSYDSYTHAGIPAEQILATNGIDKAKLDFIKQIKAVYKVFVPKNKVKFIVDTAYSE